MALIALRLRPSTPATEVEKGAASWNPLRLPARVIVRIGSAHRLWVRALAALLMISWSFRAGRTSDGGKDAQCQRKRRNDLN